MESSPLAAGRLTGPRGRAALVALIGICTAVELALVLADLGLAGPGRLRALAYEYGGFWPGLLSGWRPNYALQPGAMFLTYGFLHGGPLHLAVNMVTLWSLGVVILARGGLGAFCLIYLAALLGGAVAYALLAGVAHPMVGASGALFGLAGAYLAWIGLDRRSRGAGLWPVARAGLLLLALNVVMWWALSGRLAWQTHLGGFAAGAAVALLMGPRA